MLLSSYSAVGNCSKASLLKSICSKGFGIYRWVPQSLNCLSCYFTVLLKDPLAWDGKQQGPINHQDIWKRSCLKVALEPSKLLNNSQFLVSDKKPKGRNCPPGRMDLNQPASDWVRMRRHWYGFSFWKKKKKKYFLKKVFSPKAINTSFGFNKVNGPFFKKEKE